MNYVIVVSDGTGGTASRALDAALTQFQNIPVEIIVRKEVQDAGHIHAVIDEAEALGALVVHTLVSNDLRHVMVDQGRRHNVETIDLMGPLLDRLSQQLAVTPLEKPGLFRQLNESYFRRIESMEFAIQHDDGRRVEELSRAEIVLVGVSRTFKTPLCIYLAFKGWFAANVPIILGLPPPAILDELPSSNVFGLTMNTTRLATLRRTRAEYLGNVVQDYADIDQVRREVIYSLRIIDRPPRWPVIDVTGKPIEEIASEIITLKRQHRTEASEDRARDGW